MRSTIRRVLKGRFMRFAGIGLLCLLFVQQPILLGLMEVGVNPLFANAVGFVLSALVNYELQRRFTFDKEVKGTWLTGLRKFLLTSLVSLGANSVVFAAVFYGAHWLTPQVVSSVDAIGGGRFSIMAWAASFIGAVSGTGVNFVASRYWTFGSKAEREEAPADVEQLPQLHKVQRAVRDKTVAVFLPAYNEAENLPVLIQNLWGYLTSLSPLEFRIFIINDGSRDTTGAVADQLARTYNGVEVIHHPENQGYGGALRTGFRAVVGTGYDMWGFLDGDGQFAPQSFGTLFTAFATSDADMVVGRRIGRRTSDSPFRYWLGRVWHLYGKLIVGRNAEGRHLLVVADVDCGMKMGSVKSLAAIVHRLRGNAAAISPELIARTVLAGQTIEERGVTHLPRQAGSSTGDKLHVAVRSAFNILKLGMRLRATLYFGWTRNPAEDALNSLEGR